MKLSLNKLFVFFWLLVAAQSAMAQAISNEPIKRVLTLPTVCSPTVSGKILAFKTVAPRGFYICTETNTWTPVGTLSNVSLSLPSIFSVTTPTLLSNGTLTAELARQSPFKVFASPTNQLGGAPLFRSLVAEDIPVLGAEWIRSGILQPERLATGTASSATFMRGNSTWSPITSGDVGLGNVDNTSDASKWAAPKILTNTNIDGAAAGNSITNTSANRFPVASALPSGTCTNGGKIYLTGASFGDFTCKNGAWSQYVTASAQGSSPYQLFQRNAANTDFELVDLIAGANTTITRGTTGGVANLTISSTGGGGAATGAPVATNVAYTGTQEVGQTLTRTFTRTDAEGDAAGTPIDQWYRADSPASGGAVTNSAPIAGATAPTYTLTSADLGKIVRPSVIPTSLTGATTGGQVFGAWSGVIAAAGGGGGETAVTFTGVQAGTITGGNSVAQTDPNSFLKGNTTQSITIGGTAETYFEFGLTGTGSNFDEQSAALQPATGSPYTGFVTPRMRINFGSFTGLYVNEVEVATTTRTGTDRFAMGTTATGLPRFWKNDVVIYTGTTPLTSESVVMYFQVLPGLDTFTRGYGNVVYK